MKRLIPAVPLLAAASEGQSESIQTWVSGVFTSSLVLLVGFLLKRSIDAIDTTLKRVDGDVAGLKTDVAILKDREKRAP